MVLIPEKDLFELLYLVISVTSPICDAIHIMLDLFYVTGGKENLTWGLSSQTYADVPPIGEYKHRRGSKREGKFSNSI